MIWNERCADSRHEAMIGELLSEHSGPVVELATRHGIHGVRLQEKGWRRSLENSPSRGVALACRTGVLPLRIGQLPFANEVGSSVVRVDLPMGSHARRARELDQT